MRESIELDGEQVILAILNDHFAGAARTFNNVRWSASVPTGIKPESKDFKIVVSWDAPAEAMKKERGME